ncbi:MAG: hypothetical protein ABJH63_20315 [Rhizobiaceae bacterium]
MLKLIKVGLVAVVMAMGCVSAWAGINGKCRGIDNVLWQADGNIQRHESTEKYRFASGKVYYSRGQEKETFYETIRQSDYNPTQYIAGHKRFITSEQDPYVITADMVGVKITRLVCAFTSK